METRSDIYEQIGEIGSYQLILFIIISSTTLSPSLTGYSYVFIGAVPDFRYLKYLIFFHRDFIVISTKTAVNYLIPSTILMKQLIQSI